MNYHKRGTHIGIACILVLVLAGWGDKEASLEGMPSSKLNIVGTVTTNNDKTYTVENILLGKMFKDIPFYEKPNDSTQTKLNADPKKGIIDRFSLTEIIQLNVPSTIIYTYQPRKSYIKIEYIEVQVVWKDSSKAPSSYLVETTRKITCTKGKAPNIIEEEIPFAALKTLQITCVNTAPAPVKKALDFIKCAGQELAESVQAPVPVAAEDITQEGSTSVQVEEQP
jgi:hypothetical protein